MSFKISLVGILFIVSFNIYLIECGNEQVDVVVVGGGLAALTTAYRLAQAGLTVTVLDGDKELGGRTRSATYRGHSVSVGGTWSLFENTFTLELANEVNNLPIIPPIFPRKIAIQRIVLNPFLLLKFWFVGYEMSKRDDYWNSDGAKELDNMSVEQWIQNEQKKDSWPSDSLQAVRDYFWLNENFSLLNQTEISALHACILLHKRLRILSAEGLYTKGFFRWEGGTGVFINSIVDAIKRLGGTLLSSSPVTAIDYTNQDQVVVTYANGNKLTAKKVVIATSLTSAARISYNPPLPTKPNYIELFQSIVPSDNDAVQVMLSWDTKWYVLQGNAVLPDPLKQPSCGFYGLVFEVTPAGTTDGILRTIILDAEHSYDCLNRDDKSNNVSDNMVTKSAKAWFKSVYTFLGLPLSSYAIETYFIQTDIYDWREHKPMIPGVIYYFPSNGSIVKNGDALRTPVANRIYWAGSERAVNGLNWMEGAIQSGNKAACEVLADFGLVPNCTVYSNWLDYMVLLFKNTTNYKNLLSLQILNFNVLSQYACQIVTQTGYACLSKEQPWREPITAVEQEIMTLVNTTLIQLTEVLSVVESAAQLVVKTVPLDFLAKLINDLYIF